MNLSPALSSPTQTVWCCRWHTQQLGEGGWGRDNYTTITKVALAISTTNTSSTITTSKRYISIITTYLEDPLASLPWLLPKTPLQSGQKVPFFHCLWQGAHMVWL